MLEDGAGKILAGGMSLIPLMKLRLAPPETVVDLRRVPGLNDIAESGGIVRIGAMATHHEIESSPVIRGKCPLLAETAAQIGDAQVRNVGTIGGTVAHADPSADYPAALRGARSPRPPAQRPWRAPRRSQRVLPRRLHHRNGARRNHRGHRNPTRKSPAKATSTRRCRIRPPDSP